MRQIVWLPDPSRPIHTGALCGEPSEAIVAIVDFVDPYTEMQIRGRVILCAHAIYEHTPPRGLSVGVFLHLRETSGPAEREA